MLNLNLNLNKINTYKFIADKKKFVEEVIFLCLEKYSYDELNNFIVDIHLYDFFITKEEFDSIVNKIEDKLEIVLTKQQSIKSYTFEKCVNEAPSLFYIENNCLHLLNTFFVNDLLKNISNYNLLDVSIELDNKLDYLAYFITKLHNFDNTKKISFIDLVENSNSLYEENALYFISTFETIYSTIRENLFSINQIVLNDVISYLNTKKNLIDGLKNSSNNIDNKKRMLKKVEIFLNKTNKIIKDKRSIGEDNKNIFILFRFIKKQLEKLNKTTINFKKYNIDLESEIDKISESLVDIGNKLNSEIVVYIKMLLDIIKKEQHNISKLEYLNNFYTKELDFYESKQINNNKQEIYESNISKIEKFLNINRVSMMNDDMTKQVTPNKVLSTQSLTDYMKSYKEIYQNKYDTKEMIVCLDENEKNEIIKKEVEKSDKINSYIKYFNNLYVSYKKSYNNEYTAINVKNYLTTIDLIELNEILSYIHRKDITIDDINWLVRQELFLRSERNGNE